MQDNPNMPQADINTAILKLTYGLEGVQKDLIAVRDQLRQFEKSYVPSRENDMQLNVIRDSIHRMESDIDAMQKLLSKLEQMVRDQEASSRDRDAAQKEAIAKLVKDQENTAKARDDALNDKLNELSKTIDKLTIRALWFFVSGVFSIVITVVGGLVLFYLTNFHH